MKRKALVAVEGEAQRLGPRLSVEADAVALGDLPLEGVHLRVQSRERRQVRLVVVAHGMGGDEDLPFRIVQHQAVEAHPVVGGQGEVVGHVVAFIGEPRVHQFVERGVRDLGNLLQTQGPRGIVGYKVVHNRAI